MIRTGKLIPILLIVAAGALIVFGIFSVVARPNSVHGQVINVQSSSVTIIAKLTIEDESGKRWTFTGAQTFSGFTPSHLEEHRALRESITVEYEETEHGEFTIVRLSD